MKYSLDRDLTALGFWRRSSGKQILKLRQCVFIFLGSSFTGFYLKAVVERCKNRTNVSFTVLFCLSPLTLPSPPGQGHHLAVLTPCNPMDCSPPGSSVCEILQARILKWVAMPSSRGSSQPRGSNQCLLHWQAGSLPPAPPFISKHSPPHHQPLP